MSRVVLVTGGTRGIGRGIAEVFAAAGDTVVVCGRREPEGLTGLDFLAADVRDPEACRTLVEGVVARHGRLDVLVNNAGGAPPAETATASPRFHDRIIGLNLTAPLTLSQLAHGVMDAQPEGGVIVNVASVSALRPSPLTAAYGAAKAGLLNLTRTLAVEWAPRIRVVAVTPGLILTEDAEAFYGDRKAAIAATVPLGRFGTPEDVAQAVLWLASPAASYVSGTHLVLDGGGEQPAWLRAREESS
ncbi:MAG: SDR family oxidoreductase [Alphaproteobacteria bacterium]|nr:SDR family oxidoreductase [Alphaproteobacteria bacterium]